MRQFAIAAFVAAAGAANASFSLTITEIWAGGLPGSEVSADWFEVTNFGNTTETLDGTFYDDDSDDPTANDAIIGLSSIAAGESVLVITSWEDDWATSGDAIQALRDAWGGLAGVQIGYVDGGSGLGSSSDAANIFDGNTAGANTISRQSYDMDTQVESFIYNPITGVFGEYAQVGVFGAFESVLPASSSLLDPAVGSPGVVPAPASAALLGLAGLAARRRR